MRLYPKWHAILNLKVDGGNHMNCPYCSNKMKSGMITGDGRRALTWTEERKIETVKDFVQNLVAPYDEILCDGYIITHTHLDCHRCDACQKIIIDLAKVKCK